MPADRHFSPAIRGLLTIRPAPLRWPFAAAVAACTAALVATGWAAGDIGAGLIATLGVFTADYGSRRPYVNRAFHLAVIAVALAAAVTIGVWSAQSGWLAVTSVSAVAVGAVWLCSGLAVGPPGAFIFALACAAGVGVSASHRSAWQVCLLVLTGGIVSSTAAMIGALTDVRGLERGAVAGAGEAVAAYVEAANTAGSATTRRAAATSLTYAWAVLIDYQPRTGRAGGLLNRLRQANHALHVLFTDAMAAASRGESMPPGTASLARSIGTLDRDPAVVARRDGTRPPLRRPGTATRLIRAVRPDAHTRRVMLRVAIAAPLAGACVASSGISHAYWAMAAAVLMLHQGDHRIATFQRGAGRVIGTLAGLCLAAVILGAGPTGLWLALVLASLQFAIKMSNVRNYALATVFTTATGLTIASAAHRVDVGSLLLDRALDTVIGCGIGILVYLVAARLQEAHRIRESLTRTMMHVLTATEFLARGDGSSPAARSARRDLQESIFDLNAADDAAHKGSQRDRANAARLNPVVAATEHLGFATIAACWAAEQGRAGLFGSADADSYLALLRDLANSADAEHTPAITGELPPFAAPEIRELLRALHCPGEQT